MLVFIDECGDHGVKFDKHSSTYFTVAMVIFRDDGEAETCDQKIDKFREKLGLNAGFEFHFKKSSTLLKQKFIEVIQYCDFSYYAFVIDKRLVNELGYTTKHSLYEYALQLICEYTKDTLINARIIIDEQGGEGFRSWFSTSIKQEMNTADSKRVKKVILENSRKNNLLQLVDYVVGIIHRHYDKEKFVKVDYFSQIDHKCIKTIIRPSTSKE